MATPGSLEMLLSGLRTPAEGTKEASDKTAPAARPTSLTAAIAEASASTATKTAAEAAATAPRAELTPVQALEKIAADTIAMQDELQTKKAQLLGKIIADEAIARIGSYEKLAGERIAAGTTAMSFTKVASEHPVMIREAAQIGYDKVANYLQRVWSAEKRAGFEEGLKIAHEKAANEFMKAAQVTNALLRRAS